ncbi:MAG: hypothetical protein IZT57_01435 [Chloroflexi bacterium]|nr:hypothetical protein [Chloroflexota bacterium]
MRSLLLTSALLLSSYSALAFAGSDFKCKVTDSVKLLENGKMGAGKMSYSSKATTQELGKEFTVNRLSGEMTGSGFENNKFGAKPTVYSLSHDTAYSVITISKPSGTIDYLEIQEWVDGPQKPFLFRGGWTLQLVSGLCEYF